MKKIIIGVFIISVIALMLTDSCKKSDSGVNSPTPLLVFSDTAVIFDAGQSQKIVSISNGGEGTLTWKLTKNAADTWLTVTPDSGTSGTQLTITIDPTQLLPGTHASSLGFKSNGGDKTLSITVLISKLLLSVHTTSFSSTEDTKLIQISNSGAGKLNWNLIESPEISWLAEDISSGENEASINFTVDRTGLPTGSQNGLIVISSTGGTDSLHIAMTKLPSSSFVEEFSTNLNNWVISNASSSIVNGLLELTGTSSTSYGTAAHAISPAKTEPWAYRLAFGRKNSSTSYSRMVMMTNDAGTIVVPALSFDIAPKSDRNWEALAFVFNYSTLSGGWALLDNDAMGTSSNIKTDPGLINDITWTVSAAKKIEIFVNGVTFYQSNILNELGITIETGLESVEIWTISGLTTTADWAIVRDVASPESKIAAPTMPSKTEIMKEKAKTELMRITQEGTSNKLPTLREALEKYR